MEWFSRWICMAARQGLQARAGTGDGMLCVRHGPFCVAPMGPGCKCNECEKWNKRCCRLPKGGEPSAESALYFVSERVGGLPCRRPKGGWWAINHPARLSWDRRGRRNPETGYGKTARMEESPLSSDGLEAAAGHCFRQLCSGPAWRVVSLLRTFYPWARGIRPRLALFSHPFPVLPRPAFVSRAPRTTARLSLPSTVSSRMTPEGPRGRGIR